MKLGSTVCNSLICGSGGGDTSWLPGFYRTKINPWCLYNHIPVGMRWMTSFQCAPFPKVVDTGRGVPSIPCGSCSWKKRFVAELHYSSEHVSVNQMHLLMNNLMRIIQFLIQLCIILHNSIYIYIYNIYIYIIYFFLLTVLHFAYIQIAMISTCFRATLDPSERSRIGPSRRLVYFAYIQIAMISTCFRATLDPSERSRIGPSLRLAKLCGSYEALRDSHHGALVMALTGWTC